MNRIGTKLFVALVAAMSCTTASEAAGPFLIDVGLTQPSSSPVESGWTELGVEVNGLPSISPTVMGVTFTAHEATRGRDRGGPNPLTRDYLGDTAGGPEGEFAGIQIDGLPDGIWLAEIWAWDQSFQNGNILQRAGIREDFNGSPSITLMTSQFNHSPSNLVPATSFTFNSASLTGPWAIIVQEDEPTSSGQVRFNALRLSMVVVPEPGTLTVFGLAATALAKRRRR